MNSLKGNHRRIIEPAKFYYGVIRNTYNTPTLIVEELAKFSFDN